MSYTNRKRALIKEIGIEGLRILRDNPDSDFHIVFDADPYVDYELENVNRLTKPIVFIHLNSHDVRLVETKLGYPVINLS